jgi:hypothetical protein
VRETSALAETDVDAAGERVAFAELDASADALGHPLALRDVKLDGVGTRVVGAADADAQPLAEAELCGVPDLDAQPLPVLDAAVVCDSDTVAAPLPVASPVAEGVAVAETVALPPLVTDVVIVAEAVAESSGDGVAAPVGSGVSDVDAQPLVDGDAGADGLPTVHATSTARPLGSLKQGSPNRALSEYTVHVDLPTHAEATVAATSAGSLAHAPATKPQTGAMVSSSCGEP